MAAFDGLGKALRWLRARQDKRQYQVAEEAGVTKAMLSAYETGKQRPSLETLEKILDGLDATLADLYQALRIVNDPNHPLRAAALPRALDSSPSSGSLSDLDLRRLLGIEGDLPEQEELAFREMLGGFHRLLRYFHQRLAELPPVPTPAD
jgi:transcriptional regulator with XRE-family HTH domain